MGSPPLGISWARTRPQCFEANLVPFTPYLATFPRVQSHCVEVWLAWPLSSQGIRAIHYHSSQCLSLTDPSLLLTPHILNKRAHYLSSLQWYLPNQCLQLQSSYWATHQYIHLMSHRQENDTPSENYKLPSHSCFSRFVYCLGVRQQHLTCEAVLMWPILKNNWLFLKFKTHKKKKSSMIPFCFNMYISQTPSALLSPPLSLPLSSLHSSIQVVHMILWPSIYLATSLVPGVVLGTCLQTIIIY